MLVNQVRWRVLAATTVGLMCVSATLGGVAASAASAGPAKPATPIKGDPQPELKPFTIAATGAGGATAAIEPNGAMAVAYDIAGGDGKVVVCVLDRGASKCSSTVTLSPLAGDDTEDTPSAYVFAPSTNHVDVLMDTCCDDAAGGDTLLFSSANGGKTFAAPVRVGGVGPGAAARVGSQLVFADGGGDVDGVDVESIPALGASGPSDGSSNPIAATSYGVGVGSYKSGALVASDNDGAKWTTYVSYAAAGKSFNATGSYRSVGSFPNEELVGLSGDVLLTQEVGGAEAYKVRLFNGTTFGPAHVVPGSGGGGPEWFSEDTDPRGQAHVFSDRAFSPVSYDLYLQSSWTGATWSGPLNLGNGITSDYFGSALDSLGSGVVVGTADHEPVWVHPVLGPQGVTFTLKSSVIRPGTSTVGSGKGSPLAKGRAVQLQVERSGEWYWVATAHENASGAFSFTIKGAAPGTRDYRAVASDFAGYLQYGYSPARALKVS
jgi:hypothetical protein